MKPSLTPIIGIEIHIELATKTKMFCGCSADHFRRPPNTHTCPVCLGLPGALPMPNKKAIEAVILLAGIFQSKINRRFLFDRKNYFYPDLPKGYQISQHFFPIGQGGQVTIMDQGQFVPIALQDIHLEEDTGKLIHQKDSTLIDYNRSGVPLVEIVSQPNIHSWAQAKEYLKRIQQTARWLGISECDMEKGSMRMEANISLSPNPKILPDYKVEIKNLNSFRFTQKAIDYEIARQKEIILKGERPKQETRGYNVQRGITYSQRTKEEAKDYRYFPEPDIPPFEFSLSAIKNITKKIKTTPWEKEKELISRFGLSWENSQILVSNRKMLDLFEEVVKLVKDKKLKSVKLANLLINKKIPWENLSPKEVLQALKEKKDKFLIFCIFISYYINIKTNNNSIF